MFPRAPPDVFKLAMSTKRAFKSRNVPPYPAQSCPHHNMPQAKNLRTPNDSQEWEGPFFTQKASLKSQNDIETYGKFAEAPRKDHGSSSEEMCEQQFPVWRPVLKMLNAGFPPAVPFSGPTFKIVLGNSFSDTFNNQLWCMMLWVIVFWIDAVPPKCMQWLTS